LMGTPIGDHTEGLDQFPDAIAVLEAEKQFIET